MPLTDTDINPGQHNKPAHYPGGAMVGRRDSRLAPYRHYPRLLHRQNLHAKCPWGLATPSGAMRGRYRPWGFPTLPASALPPLPTQNSHRIARGGSTPRKMECPNMPPVRIWEAQTAGTCKDARRRQCDSFLS